MPKRPCAIAITPDNSTILCADKFGDVYSLPLKGQTVEFSTAKVDMDEVPISQTNEIPQAPFSPSATSLTVHTKGNREALRQQQTAKSGKTQKTSLRFDHQLLLGHVSLLTDVVCATITSSHAPRHYILTSDRDEHIRVSRGIPHSHIIEGYCLGHTGFVSKLCILPNHPHLLLSGGGDDYLLLWNWHLGTIQQRIEISGHVESFRDRYTKGMTDKLNSIQPEETAIRGHDIGSRIAVSNIIVVEAQSGTQVAVTCEGYVS